MVGRIVCNPVFPVLEPFLPNPTHSFHGLTGLFQRVVGAHTALGLEAIKPLVCLATTPTHVFYAHAVPVL